MKNAKHDELLKVLRRHVKEMDGNYGTDEGVYTESMVALESRKATVGGKELDEYVITLMVMDGDNETLVFCYSLRPQDDHIDFGNYRYYDHSAIDEWDVIADAVKEVFPDNEWAGEDDDDRDLAQRLALYADPEVRQETADYYMQQIVEVVARIRPYVVNPDMSMVNMLSDAHTMLVQIENEITK